MWKKYCREGQATDDKMAHAHCVLDTQGYKHILRTCNTYFFSMATINARTRPQCYVKRILPVLFSVKLVYRCADPNTRHVMSYWKTAFGERSQNYCGSRISKPGAYTILQNLSVPVRITYIYFHFEFKILVQSFLGQQMHYLLKQNVTAYT
jgi:hypothetical protein